MRKPAERFFLAKITGWKVKGDLCELAGSPASRHVTARSLACQYLHLATIS